MYRYIRCMGSTRRSIYEDLDNKADELVAHLIKIILYRNNGNLEHWCKELYGFVPSVPRLKGSHKYPAREFIYKALTDGPFQHFSSLVSAIKDSYDYQYYSVSNEVMKNYVGLYIDWASDKLSRTGLLPGKNACANKAKEILDQFEV